MTNTGSQHLEAEMNLPRRESFTAQLFLFWNLENQAELTLARAEAREPDRQFGIIKLMDSVRASWPEEDRHKFIEAKLGSFRRIHKDAAVLTELERRGVSGTESTTILKCLSDLAMRVDAVDDYVAVQAVISGLVEQYYGVDQRVAYIFEMIDFEIDDMDIDELDEEDDDDLVDDDKCDATSSEDRHAGTSGHPVMRGVGTALGAVAVIAVPWWLAERLVPAVGPSYETATFVPAYIVVCLLLGAVYQSGRGEFVIAWRCAFASAALTCGAVTYFQTGWHWAEAQATVRALPSANSLTPFPKSMTPWFATSAIICALAALAFRERIESLLRDFGMHLPKK